MDVNNSRIQLTAKVITDLASGWTPHEGQIEVLRPLLYGGKRRIFVECGRKFGKTESVLYLLHREAMQNPNHHYYFIAPTIKQARELIWENNRLKGFLTPEVTARYVYKDYEQDMRRVFNNGSFIKLDGADNWPSYAGINPHGLAYDEFKDIDPRFYDVMEPNLASKDAWMYIVGTPPDSEENLFCRLAEEFKGDDQSDYFNMPTWTNPHIPAKWLERQKERLISRGDHHVWLREYEAKRVRGGARSIFPMFEPAKTNPVSGEVLEFTRHVRPEGELEAEIRRHQRDYEFYQIFDPGSVVCFAVIFAAVHKYSKKVIILDEIYEKDKAKTSTKQIYPRAMQMYAKFGVPGHKVHKVFDYAAQWFANEVAAEYGEGLMPCTKDLNDKENKLSVIKDFMVASLFEVGQKCKWTVWEISNYIVDDNGKIPKKNDHIIDSLRYLFNAANLRTTPRERYVRDPDSRIWVPEHDSEFADEGLIGLDFYQDLDEDEETEGIYA